MAQCFLNLFIYVFFLILAKGEYMSIFFCILRGEHDSLLQWPFSQKITFSLVDQSLVVLDNKENQGGECHGEVG